MKAVILCGGRGTRIRELSETVPKPMVQIGDRPILWHIMKMYSAHGIHDFILALGYKGDVIREFFLNFAVHTADVTIDLSRTGPERLSFHGAESEPWKVTLVDTGYETMTGARIRRVRKYLDPSEDFCVTYGDGVGDVDITALLRYHRDHGKTATVTGVRPPGRFGELSLVDDTVHLFNEKPQVGSGFISGGFFVFRRQFADTYLDDREDLMLEREPLERLAADGQLKMYRHDGFWQPMDTPREYQLLSDLWASGAAPWKMW